MERWSLQDSIYNDLGFAVGDKLIIMVECQSTWTVNIIIRVLMYLVQSWIDYFERTDQNLYKSKKVKMPVPELYAILFRYRNKIIYGRQENKTKADFIVQGIF